MPKKRSGRRGTSRHKHVHVKPTIEMAKTRVADMLVVHAADSKSSALKTAAKRYKAAREKLLKTAFGRYRGK